MSGEDILALVLFYFVWHVLMMFVVLIIATEEKFEPRKTILSMLFAGVTGTYYLCCAMCYGTRGVYRSLYYGLRYNRTYEQEMERRDRLVSTLKGE